MYPEKLKSSLVNIREGKKTMPSKYEDGNGWPIQPHAAVHSQGNIPSQIAGQARDKRIKLLIKVD